MMKNDRSGAQERKCDLSELDTGKSGEHCRGDKTESTNVSGS